MPRAVSKTKEKSVHPTADSAVSAKAGDTLVNFSQEDAWKIRNSLQDVRVLLEDWIADAELAGVQTHLTRRLGQMRVTLQEAQAAEDRLHGRIYAAESAASEAP